MLDCFAPRIKKIDHRERRSKRVAETLNSCPNVKVHVHLVQTIGHQSTKRSVFASKTRLFWSLAWKPSLEAPELLSCQEWIDRRLQKAVGRPKVLRRAFWALQSLLCESCGRRSPCTREACNSQRCKFIGENKKLWGVDLCCRCGEEYVDINYYQERIQETLRHHRRVQELLSAKQVKELLIWNMDPGGRLANVLVRMFREINGRRLLLN